MTLTTIDELVIPEPEPERQPLRHFTLTNVEIKNGERSDHRIREAYVEEHWLPFLGPSAMLFARKGDLLLSTDSKVAVRISAWAKGFGLTDDEVLSSIHRLVRYGLAQWAHRDTTLQLLRYWPFVPHAITTAEHFAVLRSIPDNPRFYEEYTA